MLPVGFTVASDELAAPINLARQIGQRIPFLPRQPLGGLGGNMLCDEPFNMRTPIEFHHTFQCDQYQATSQKAGQMIAVFHISVTSAFFHHRRTTAVIKPPTSQIPATTASTIRKITMLKFPIIRQWPSNGLKEGGYIKPIQHEFIRSGKVNGIRLGAHEVVAPPLKSP